MTSEVPLAPSGPVVSSFPTSISCLEIFGSCFLPGVTLATALSSDWVGGQSCGMGQMTKYWIPCGSEMSGTKPHIGQPNLLTQGTAWVLSCSVPSTCRRSQGTDTWETTRNTIVCSQQCKCLQHRKCVWQRPAIPHYRYR